MKTKFYLIKSNQGNHTGFNRTWSLIDESNRRSDLEKELLSIAFNVSDDIVERNNRPYDTNCKEYILTNKMMKDGSFSYDLVYYLIISEEDKDLFNGGSHGYLPSFLKDDEYEDD